MSVFIPSLAPCRFSLVKVTKQSVLVYVVVKAYAMPISPISIYYPGFPHSTSLPIHTMGCRDPVINGKHPTIAGSSAALEAAIWTWCSLFSVQVSPCGDVGPTGNPRWRHDTGKLSRLITGFCKKESIGHRWILVTVGQYAQLKNKRCAIIQNELSLMSFYFVACKF